MINFDIIVQSLDVLLVGLGMTLQLTVISLLIALVLGLITALMKLSKKRALNAIANAYINVMRGTPLLVQVFSRYRPSLAPASTRGRRPFPR